MAEGVGGPGGGFVSVARSTGVGDFVFVGGGGWDEGESVGADFRIRQGGLDFGHVAGDAAAAGGPGFVMGVGFERGRVRAVEGLRAVAIEAKLVGGLAELSIVAGAVSIVATEAGNAAAVHQALYEVVALHAVFVGSAVREIHEAGGAEGVVFELPEITEI